MNTLPPPMPDWTDLVSKVPPAPEVVAIPREDLPCNACGKGYRAVYKCGTVDAYCRACRKAKNHQSYLERKNRDIRVGYTKESSSLFGYGRRTTNSIPECSHRDVH